MFYYPFSGDLFDFYIGDGTRTLGSTWAIAKARKPCAHGLRVWVIPMFHIVNKLINVIQSNFGSPFWFLFGDGMRSESSELDFEKIECLLHHFIFMMAYVRFSYTRETSIASSWGLVRMDVWTNKSLLYNASMSISFDRIEQEFSVRWKALANYSNSKLIITSFEFHSYIC